jgi:hypothetical protein
MAQDNTPKGSVAALQRAARLIAEALDLVDAQGSCPDGAAHLDLALRRVRDKLASHPDWEPPLSN